MLEELESKYGLQPMTGTAVPGNSFSTNSQLINGDIHMGGDGLHSGIQVNALPPYPFAARVNDDMEDVTHSPHRH
jgi:hypothetical protein